MREIKFRAFKDGQMADWETIIEHCDRLSILKPDCPNGFILMQFTGLKDKHNKEIFEGDVIQGDLFDQRLPTMGEVVFDDYFSFYANKNQGGNTPLHKIDKIEIVGNKFINPELLEGK